MKNIKEIVKKRVVSGTCNILGCIFSQRFRHLLINGVDKVAKYKIILQEELPSIQLDSANENLYFNRTAQISKTVTSSRNEKYYTEMDS